MTSLSTACFLLALLVPAVLMPCMGAWAQPDAPCLRVPAEWEPQKAVWMQWPGNYEASLRPAFARIIAVVAQYQHLHVLVANRDEQRMARRILRQHGADEKHLHWHMIPVDNAWMRDNGPVYVTNSRGGHIRNWRFTGWDGTTGALTAQDDAVPLRVAEILGLEAVTLPDYVLERGNLEVNGQGLALLNWDCQQQRNPEMPMAQQEAILTKALGLEQIIWAYGHHPEDITTGHIDGIARFLDSSTVALAEDADETSPNLENSLLQAGLAVNWYPGDVNWLLGNGFVLARSSGDTALDMELKTLLRAWFPDRDIHLIDASGIAASGGGIHCVTNDQPDFERAVARTRQLTGPNCLP